MDKKAIPYSAILLFAVTVGSVVFNWYSPWWFTELASNWAYIDVTIFITFWICGVAFVILGVFMAYCVWKFEYREDRKADYDPENPKLESWLTGITTIGVVVMLAPGLIVWDDYVNVPPDAIEIEVFGEQWTWKFRLPGEDGVFGTTSIREVTFDNPFGIRSHYATGEVDPYGADDVIINTNTLKVPLDQNVKMVLRAKDVLHDFWVPEIRAKMDMVPGMITYFWFTPTLLGEYEILCAELCGRGHHAMRGTMHIVTQEEFQDWVDANLTHAEMQAGIEPMDPLAIEGRSVAERNGCFACHSMDGSQVVGPTWQGFWGRTVELSDGTTVTADEAYVRESITDPNSRLVKGFSPVMTPYSFDEKEMTALLRFLQETAPSED